MWVTSILPEPHTTLANSVTLPILNHYPWSNWWKSEQSCIDEINSTLRDFSKYTKIHTLFPHLFSSHLKWPNWCDSVRLSSDSFFAQQYFNSGKSGLGRYIYKYACIYKHMQNRVYNLFSFYIHAWLYLHIYYACISVCETMITVFPLKNWKPRSQELSYSGFCKR